jgi:septal ring factor EnvC (AmiA/AmiB activator)
MSGSSNYIIKTVFQKGGVVLLCLFVVTAGWGQTKEELEKKRKKLLEDIEFTKEMLQKTKQNRKSSLNQLITLRRQIEKREDVIQTIENEISLLDDRLSEQQEVIESLEEDLKSLKEEYARLVRATYKTQSAQTRLLFLFSAQDFNDLYNRYRYLKRYTAYRRQQAELIQQTQQDIEERVEELKEKKKQKRQLLQDLTQQKKTLKTEMQQKNRIVQNLQQKERSLMKEIEQKKQTARDLKKAIEDLIRKEMEASKEKGELSLTPEAAQLSANFEKNKGKLPWPVDKGVITSSFGKHPHPVLDRVEVKNNGIDIKTDTDASVKAVFEGEVKNTMYNPSFHHAVMIQHGNYFTVYSNLEKVYVDPGQTVSTKQVIGKVYNEEGSNRAEVHLEVWKGTETLNPQSWLYVVQ